MDMELLKQIVEMNKKVLDNGVLPDEFVAYFVKGDMIIYNPFFEETGREEVDPVAYYGVGNIKRMFDKYQAYIDKYHSVVGIS